MNQTSVQTDPNRIAALQKQDSAAFTQLVRDNESLVVGICQAMGLRGMDVDDAAAEAFAEVYNALPSYEGRSKISTWVYRIAFRVILKSRTQSRKLRHAERNEAVAAHGSPSAAEFAQQRDSSDQLWRAVASLEPRQAAAVELYYRRDCSIDEIAERFSCPPGTVKTLLHRARAALKPKLSNEIFV